MKPESVSAYIAYLKQEEKSRSTTEQYERNIRRFLQYLKAPRKRLRECYR